MKGKSASKSSISNLLTKLLSVGIGFISGIILAEVLGPEQRGVLSYLRLYVTFCLPILSMGAGQGVTYYISKKDYDVSNSFFTSLIIAIVQGIIAVSLVFIFWGNDFLITQEHASTIWAILPLLLIIFTNAWQYYCERTLIGKSEFIFINYMTILEQGLYILGLGSIYYFESFNVTSVLYCILFYNLVKVLLTTRKVLSLGKIELSFSSSFRNKIIKYGFKGWWGNLALLLNLRLDQFFLGKNPYLLGIYVIPVQLAEMIWVFPDSLGAVLFNQIAAEKDEDKQKNLVEKIHRLFLWGITGIAGLAAIIGPIFIDLVFSDRYLASIVPFILLLPGVITQTSVKVVTKLFGGRGKVEYNTYITLFGMAVSIILYIYAIPKWGVKGAALSSSIGYSSSAILAYYFAIKKFKLSFVNFFFIKIEDIKWILNKAKTAYKK